MQSSGAPDGRSIPQPEKPWALLDFLAGLSWRFLLCFFALAIFIFVTIQLSFVVVPLLIAILVSSILSPVAVRLRDRGLANGVAATLTVFMALAVLILVALIVIPPLISNADEFARALKGALGEIDKLLVDAPFNLDATQADAITNSLSEAGPKIEESLISGLGTIVPLVGRAAITTVLAIVMTGYMLRDGDRYWRWGLGFVEEPRQPAIDQMGRNAYRTLAAYLQGTSMVALLNSSLITLGAWFLGLPLLGPIAIIIFVAAFLPIVGAWIAAGTVILIALASQGISAAIGIGLVYLLVSAFKSYFVSPFVIGTRVNLPPIITLTAVMIGTVLAGIAGGILAVPLTATVSGALSEIRQWRLLGDDFVVEAEEHLPTEDA